MVGIPGVTGLSAEQRKRLTIAVELVASPSIIFMDEPTTSLNARAAAIVMRTVRKTVNTRRTVVCTIHQPSIEIFESFDEVFGQELQVKQALGFMPQNADRSECADQQRAAQANQETHLKSKATYPQSKATPLRLIKTHRSESQRSKGPPEHATDMGPHQLINQGP
ncbi:hypothetical protein C2845_PM03G28950 [Panicum miliaceum]|uniref:ABC transporter domain-containing protein n=1 Tax=Panicum miliaceum TaxID=4540 RepID=A0A3L6T5C5_PANMI|nr:hypothetical protein C2845_PM03G28950 [Panicum miliaceum]